jgi:hypothetical protein
MSTDELSLPDLTLLRLAEHAERLEQLDASVAVLTEQVGAVLGEGAPGRGYNPIPAPRWWLLEGEEREAAIARLAAWVDQVFRPCFGSLAASLAPCWPEHPLALFTLDWLSELHSVLYLQPRRSASMLAGQAEWQTRLLPAAAEQIARETSGCGHGRTTGRAR